VKRLACAIASALVAVSSTARADHVPGHGSSEAVRNLNSLGGGSGAASSRMLLLQEFSHSTRTLAPNTTYTTSLLGEYAPHRWFSFGAQLPLLVIDEAATSPRAGFGNLRIVTRITLHADKLFHRVLSFGVNAVFPTRTVVFTVDPGKTWVQAPYVVFTRNYRRAFWQIFATVPIETRPAGTAIDVSAAGQGGYRFWGKLAPSAGVILTVRAASWCRRPEARATLCKDGRTTEIERSMGTTIVAGNFGLSWTFQDWGMLFANVQVPFTPRRDFDVAGAIGLQALF
jgi:hypothetical protein